MLNRTRQAAVAALEKVTERLKERNAQPRQLLAIFWDSTVALTAYNALATRGDLDIPGLLRETRRFFGERVEVTEAQLGRALEVLRGRGLVRFTGEAWGVLDPKRRIIRRQIRPSPSNPDSGWIGWSFATQDEEEVPEKFAPPVVAVAEPERTSPEIEAKRAEMEKANRKFREKQGPSGGGVGG